MKTRFRARRSFLPTAAAALAVALAGPAYASPGDNFPEQPGTHLAQGCESILTNPDRALNFLTGEQHMSERAAAILIAQYIDACLGG
jgi:hypothetical protein